MNIRNRNGTWGGGSTKMVRTKNNKWVEIGGGGGSTEPTDPTPPPPMEETWREPAIIDDAYIATHANIVDGIANFSGMKWRSHLLDIPAVRIATKYPIKFLGCGFEASHWACIANALAGGTSRTTGVDVEVWNCVFTEGPRVLDRNNGAPKTLRFNDAKRLKFHNNSVTKTAGILLFKHENGTEFYIGKNKWRDVSSNWKEQSTDTRGSAYWRAYDASQMVQFNDVVEMPNIVVEWNDFYTRPGFGMEDTINIGHSSGTVASPLTVRNNMFRGVLPYPLTMTGFSATTVVIEASMYKTGMDRKHYPHNIHVHNNRGSGNNNASYNLLHGYDNLIENNKSINAGVIMNINPDYDVTTADGVRKTAADFPDGTLHRHGSAGVAFQNYIDRTILSNTGRVIGQTPNAVYEGAHEYNDGLTWFTNNRSINNIVGFNKVNSSGVLYREDGGIPKNCEVPQSGEVSVIHFVTPHVPGATASTPVTYQDEVDLYNEFLAEVQKLGITIGLVSSTVEPDPVVTEPEPEPGTGSAIEKTTVMNSDLILKNETIMN